ncbi:MAG TPA: hypothetical protein VFY12_03450 [Arenimonas sp.]|nr:hypothetical protein [Arenimonas sp.]
MFNPISSFRGSPQCLEHVDRHRQRHIVAWLQVEQMQQVPQPRLGVAGRDKQLRSQRPQCGVLIRRQHLVELDERFLSLALSPTDLDQRARDARITRLDLVCGAKCVFRLRELAMLETGQAKRDIRKRIAAIPLHGRAETAQGTTRLAAQLQHMTLSQLDCRQSRVHCLQSR